MDRPTVLFGFREEQLFEPGEKGKANSLLQQTERS